MRGKLGWIAGASLVLAVATDAAAWVVRDQPAPGESRFGQGVALGPDGNPVVAGWYYHTTPGQDFRAAKYAATDGALIWSYGTGGLPVGSTANAFAVAVDSAGAAFVGGQAYTNTADVYDGIVVKLSGVDGSEIWRHDFAGADYQTFTRLALTSDGDVIVLDIEGAFFTTSPVVHRLDGATGTEEWMMPITGTMGAGGAFGLAVDAADNVLVGGDVPTLTGSKAFVAKLSGTGSELWRALLAESGAIGSIAVDGVGDVVGAGYMDSPMVGNQFGLVVAKFDGDTGASLWQYYVPSVVTGGYANAVAVDAAGDVLIAGNLENDFLAGKLDGTTGAELWQRRLSGKDYPVGYTMAVSSAGSAIVGGVLDYRFTLASFASATGDTQWLEQLPGDRDDWGYALGVTIGSGYIFATGSTVFPLVSQEDRPGALTVARFVDPDSPPVIGNCSPAPRTDCRGAIEPARAKLTLRDMPGARSDRLQWKLTKGEATALADFGAPLVAGNDFTLCLYDGTSARIFSVAVPSGGTCGTVPCWRASGTTSVVYHAANPREPEGLDKMKLTSGAAGKMKIQVTRKGRSNLDVPIPAVAGLTLPLTIQLQQDGGNCFSSTFSPSGIIRNDGITLKAVSD
jgi:hypothetical protein